MAWTGWELVEEEEYFVARRAARAGELDEAAAELESFELRPGVVAAALVTELRRSRSSWCNDRRCGHRVGKHKDGVCTIDGCACEGLQEEL